MSPVILLLLAAGYAEPLGPELSLAQALDAAAVHSPRLAVAEQEVAAAAAGARAVRSYLLPSLEAGANVLWWDSASTVPYSEFLGPLTGSDACAGLEEYMQEFCQQFLDGMTSGLGEGGITLRDARTQQLTAQVTQPLSGLYGISQGWRAARAMEASARSERDQVAGEVGVEVVSAWAEAAKVAALERLAAEALETLAAHEARADAFYEAGLIGRNELLQLQVAKSEAQLDRRRAEGGARLARGHLAVVMGAEARQVAPAPMDLATLPRLELDPEALASIAIDVSNGPQVGALRHKATAAAADRNRLAADRLPQLAAIAHYERNWGVGSLAIPESWFVGLGLDWDVWSWGRKHYAAEQAAARARQAQVGLAALSDGLLLQAQAALEEALMAQEAREVRRDSVAQADENLRIVQARFEAHTATATDLLEAQTLRAKAATDEITAAYDYLVAVAKLQQALGLVVDPLAGVHR
ncbi:MAG: TolC family protein [Pseudomonadota bacterium]